MLRCVLAAALVASTGALQLNGLLARRSVVKYDTAKEVPAEATDRALQAAILAPNHFLSEPWRFYSCGPETKAKLCGLNEDKRKMAEGVPCWMIVTISSEHEVDAKLGAPLSAAATSRRLEPHTGSILPPAPTTHRLRPPGSNLPAPTFQLQPQIGAEVRLGDPATIPPRG